MRHWLRSYALLLKWNLLRQRFFLPFMAIIQTLLAAGIILGFSFLLPETDPVTVLYLSTGAPTVILVVVGMVAAPQEVAMQKREGFFDYYRALPVPRLAMLAADATVWTALAAPGVVLALGMASLRFDLTLSVSLWVVPAFLLVVLTAVAVGYGISYASHPRVTGMITQVIVFIALMFAPVNYPAERLPDWYAAVHQVLPFQYMAQAMRESLQPPVNGVSLLPYLMLTIWALAGLAVTTRLMTRRT